jgi:thiamine pyrophosphokinase
MPDAVIGDMDSILDLERWRETAKVLQIDEQDSTDFGKCLCATEAPFYVAVGFTGKRIDHMLAVFSTLLSMPDKTVILIGETEIAALVPGRTVIEISQNIGAIVSIYPLVPVTGTVSKGLKWNIQGLAMRAGQQIGTSNEAIGSRVSVGFDQDGALLMLERQYLETLLAALVRNR